MSADVNKAIAFVLNNEVAPGTNPFSDRAIDRGGPTSWGITLKTASLFFGRNLTGDELKTLVDHDKAVEIITKLYWVPLKLSSLNDTDIATAILDQDVNRGAGNAIKEVKETLRELNYPILDSDPWTKALSCVNGVPAEKFIPRFQAVIKGNYITIVTNDPTQQGNLRGWLRRVDLLSTLTAVT